MSDTTKCQIVSQVKRHNGQVVTQSLKNKLRLPTAVRFLNVCTITPYVPQHMEVGSFIEVNTYFLLYILFLFTKTVFATVFKLLNNSTTFLFSNISSLSLNFLFHKPLHVFQITFFQCFLLNSFSVTTVCTQFSKTNFFAQPPNLSTYCV